jgi:hypothetical protein
MSAAKLAEAAKALLTACDTSVYTTDYCGLEVSKHDATQVTAAIEALREALEAKPQPGWCKGCTPESCPGCGEAAPANEPIGYIPADVIPQLAPPRIVLDGVPVFTYQGAGTIPIYAEPVAPAPGEPVAWAISYDGKTPYALWDYGDGALLDLEIKRLGGTWSKMPLYAAAAAPAPAQAQQPLTWDQFVAACEAEYGEDFAPEEFMQASEEEQAEIMRVVRMLERANVIGIAASKKENL